MFPFSAMVNGILVHGGSGMFLHKKSFQWRHLLGGVPPNSFVFTALELSDSDNEQLSVLKMILIVFFF